MYAQSTRQNHFPALPLDSLDVIQHCSFAEEQGTISYHHFPSQSARTASISVLSQRPLQHKEHSPRAEQARQRKKSKWTTWTSLSKQNAELPAEATNDVYSFLPPIKLFATDFSMNTCTTFTLEYSHPYHSVSRTWEVTRPCFCGETSPAHKSGRTPLQERFA